MGGWLGIGNSSGRTDRSNQLGGINAEWNVYNRGLPFSDTDRQSGLDTVKTGMGTLDEAKKKWEAVTSGVVNKPAVMRAAAPAIETLNTGSDAARAQQAEMGTARGGGVNEANQAAESDRIAKTADIVGQATAQQQNVDAAGAQGLSGIGTAQTTVGQRQLAQALSELGLSGEVAQEIIESSIKSRPISMKANAEIRQQWSDLLAALGL